MKIKILVFLLSWWCSTVFGQHKLTGSVYDKQAGVPLRGSLITILESGQKTITNEKGLFEFSSVNGNFRVVAKHVGFKNDTIKINSPVATPIVFNLIEETLLLKEVILSTGYEKIPIEKTTGSYNLVSEKDFNRRISTDVLSRLEDVVPGLVINRNTGSGKNNISIRGQSTLFANARPLIVLDDFPYEGDLETINPNDIESITVLKDAAAASIWGVRAGNGVIVLTSKMAKLGQPVNVSYNSNLTIGQKKNLYYLPEMSVNDFVDTEMRLFNEGYYTASELSVGRPVLSPVVELLIAKRDGLINEQKFNDEIGLLKTYDLKREQSDLLYRNSVNMQHSLSISGGLQNYIYNLSVGYDNNKATEFGNEYQRFSLKSNHILKYFDDKLQLSMGLLMTNTKQDLNALPSNLSIYPYTKLQDQDGNALAINKDYRRTVVDQVEPLGLLNWQYKPMEELNLANHFTRLSDLQLNLRLAYQISKSFNVSLSYVIGKDRTQDVNLLGLETYEVRNLINRIAQKTAEGLFNWPVPIGDIRDDASSSYLNKNMRAQLSYNKLYGDKHDIRFFSGYEFKDLNRYSEYRRLYGYDSDHLTSSIVDYSAIFPSYLNPQQGYSIQNKDEQKELNDRFLSYFTNLGYVFDKRFMLSVSGRLDQSNLFGVRANQKGVPLWSIGAGWNISSEHFYKSKFMPILKAKITYGYNGNIDKSLSAYTTARYFDGKATITKQPYADVVNPPNPDLRWERVSVTNFQVEFALMDNVVTGSLEYYLKEGKDLIGSIPYPPSSGVSVFKGNTANIRGSGFDAMISTINVNKRLKWNTQFLFSYNTDKVTKYLTKGDVNSFIQFGDGLGIYPLMGRPLYALYSYRWAGLDPHNGDPVGYLNGIQSKDYAAIRGASTVENIVYNGRARAAYFGSLKQYLTYNRFSISVGVSYRIGYVFRNNSILYGNTYGLGGHGDYYNRWKNPGDEKLTDIPSIPTIPNSNRDNFYRYSEILVDKGDHIRLQDVSASYQFSNVKLKQLNIRKLEFYTYVNNLGLIWKANRWGIDPDYISGPPPLTVSFGFKLDF